ncbi:MAG: hypothetical protein ACFFEV_01405 [Candidatus Thorarchaeota archaeon]
MGDSKIIKKFQKTLEECNEVPFYSGTILEFDTVGYVPKERHTSGVIIESKSGNHRVVFCNDSQKFIENASSLKIDDEILVFIRKQSDQPKTILPTIIVVPKERLILFSRKQEPQKSEGWVENLQILSIVLSLVLGAISQLSSDISFILFSTWFMFWDITLWLGLGSFFFFFIFIVIHLYDRSSRRERVIRCDTDTWSIVKDEIIKKFGRDITSSP